MVTGSFLTSAKSLYVDLSAARLKKSAVRLFVASLVSAALLAGCSKSSSSGAAAPAASSSSSAAGGNPISAPCSLITHAEVETALGKGASFSATHNERIGMDECILKPGTAQGIEKIIMVVHPATGWDEIKKQLMEKPAPGLGDDAFQRGFDYYARRGDKYVQVFGPVTNEPAANDKATHYIAERAASRL